MVVVGPYRHVRNPMISGLLLILLAEALFFGSLPILAWFAFGFALNAVYIPLVEESGLEKRFGEEYLRYKQHVPRWIPRLVNYNGRQCIKIESCYGRRGSPRMDDGFTFQHYFIAYVDLVGQREALRTMLSIPTTSEEKDEFLALARNSLGRVLEVREWFKKYFAAVKRPVFDLTHLPAELRDVIRTVREDACNVYVLSDSIVIAVPLHDKCEHAKALSGIQTGLFALCGMAACAFAAGVALRGGLDIGIATVIDGNEVYGPAFVRAYELESQVAEYPRFALGTELVEFLDGVGSQKPRTVFEELAKRFAVECRQVIVQDTDGRQMVDFLGKTAKDTLALPSEVFPQGLAFVQQEYEKFRKADNEKLASRYFRLLQYYLARKTFWVL
jgi:hypothetical protein